MYSGSRLRLTGWSSPCVGLVRVEVGGLDVLLRGRGDPVRELDDAHRSLGVDGEVVGRLALVGDEGVLPVRRDRDHVGERSDLDGAEHGGGGIRRPSVEEEQVTGVGLGRRLDGDHAQAVGADGDRVRDAV